MSRQKTKQQRESISRFLLYVLGVRPDEFGLVPDEEGYVPFKDLLAALSEEDGWTFVRESHIMDLVREPERSEIEVKDKLIRVNPAMTELVLGPPPVVEPPVKLFHAVRRKAYPAALENGLTPGGRAWVPLFTDEKLALRFGRRRDQQPVLVTVLTEKANRRGVVFTRPQQLIYLVDSLAPDLFTGPPLPKEKPAEDKKAKPKRDQETDTRAPGSFFLAVEKDPDAARRPIREERDKTAYSKKKDGPDWKRAARKDRRRREE